ncbi:MAG: hypothetical protein AAF756_17925 [Pseudomonadota bacterium]
MMDIEYIRSNGIVDRYVLGQLTEQEQVDFELCFMSHPEILDEIEVSRALRQGLISNEQAAAEDSDSASAKLWHAAIARLSRYFESPVVLATNFSVLFALAVLAFYEPQQDTNTGYAATRVWIGTVRGYDSPINVKLESEGLVLDIDIQESGVYDVDLVNSEGELVRFARNVDSNNNALLVFFRLDGLSPGVYTVRANHESLSADVERRLELR